MSDTKPRGGPGAWPDPPEEKKGEPQNAAEPRSDGGISTTAKRDDSSSSSWAPQPKVATAATTVPFSGLVLWAVEQFGVEMPAYVAGDVAILLAVLVAYLVPEKE